MPDVRDNITVLGPDTAFKGELTFTGSCRILGIFEGAIKANGEVQIGPGAQVNASIEASSIHIDGVVQGDMLAQERLQLGAKARLSGDVTAGALAVAEGATFVGRCNVGPEAFANTSRALPHSEAKPIRTPTKPESSKSDWLGESPVVKSEWLGNTPPAGAARSNSWMNGNAPDA